MRPFFIALLLASFTLTSCATRVVHTSPKKTVVVRTAPKNHKVVVVKGQRYYTWNGNYYRKTTKGYVAVRIR